MKIACIVLPTYNESENVGILLPRIFEQADRIPSHELHVLVVDDNSPDGTAGVVRGLQARYPHLHVISGQKRGLGEAYKRGFAHAIKELDPDLILQMDADLQHSPELLPLMIGLQQYGFNFVIGSRFVLGGSTPNFSFKRRMMSLVGNWLLRNMGGLPAIKDCTSGFRCIKAELLKRCDLAGLSTKGYSFQSSLLFELARNGARIIEIPITFPDRVRGESKLGLADQIEFLLNLVRIRFRNSSEFIRFLFVGASGVVVNLGLYWVLTRLLPIGLEIAAPVAIEVSIVSNFILNNVYTFRERGSGNSLARRFLYFHVAAGLAGVVNYSIFILLVRGVGMYDILANCVGIVGGTVVNYLMNSRITWGAGKKGGPFHSDNRSMR
ncbi:Undecaprenyl-phosphate mannosyltransferase [Pseudodesulfovibrio hydrargyri]|uniref:Undecaprenyl-phosphate mannosyltransferase n=1 Tax=Pseudodesulfovibrio hydrargyri TaxID=2125990 RepID=A0A1J5MR79_9BACT|nr:glycosyltransferase family 2 protein [Pseudodesulfovibrio hydrargyri]OIQ49102.1 Undecaprenyl-phosphate mannosyltransferase [Pseudodesulfovibrio hydrargyri]